MKSLPISKKYTIKSILLDIEGTTTSISFVHDVLFPLSIKEMNAFLKKNWNNPIISEEKFLLKKELLINQSTPESLSKILTSWIKHDKKHTQLKLIQGKIWKEAYQNGEVKSHIYEDVPIALKKWQEEKISIYIYSSGSVQAQKLLFQYSMYGDLTSYLSGYFDTKIGSKKDKESYFKISEKIQVPPENILFISDSAEELDAASKANTQVVLSVRDQTQSSPTKIKYPKIESFDSLLTY